MADFYRNVRPDLEVRSGGDGRTIAGIAVPWNAPQRINSQLTEQFARGAFDHQLGAPQRVRFAREHVDLGGTLIGVAKTLRDDAAGLYVELRTSRTPVGDETLELIKDGALSHLSIGFQELRNRRVPGTNITERVTANLFEVAATMQGAFGDLAAVGAVRAAGSATESAVAAERSRRLAELQLETLLAEGETRRLNAIIAGAEQRQAEAETRRAVQVATGGLSGLIG